uniref:Vegetative cell wall protein gp1 n=1 Tax=Rhizophora mucronata TaxID=61149 RepID=A0A2P2JXZ2_RHIMU
MRHLQNSMSAVDPSKQFSGFSPLALLVSPRCNNLAPPQQQQQNNQQEVAVPQQQEMIPPSQPPLQLAASPLPFGCLNSPRSPYPLLSPSLLFSPSSFPLSPTRPVQSPAWRGH